ncbi:MAG: hypothetical protein JWM27_1221 [Gemmatimonadetes bacterium]|nr:hypothetical protein [Gemmatimonadota bacterium]
MCVLCDVTVLRRLGAAFDTLSPTERAEAIREAREAAGVVSPELAESVLRGETLDAGDPELYSRHVLATAKEEGVLSGSDTLRWRTELARGPQDPRVQAFLSSCAEYVADYQAGAVERRKVLERYLEVRAQDVKFSSIGRDGEIWFGHRKDTYAVLTDDEAMDIAIFRLTEGLPSMPAEELLPYTRLPASALDVLEGIRGRPAEEASEVLAGIVDVALMAEDRVVRDGYAAFFAEEEGTASDDTDFGEYVIVRLYPDDEAH